MAFCFFVIDDATPILGPRYFVHPPAPPCTPLEEQIGHLFHFHIHPVVLYDLLRDLKSNK